MKTLQMNHDVNEACNLNILSLFCYRREWKSVDENIRSVRSEEETNVSQIDDMKQTP